MPRTDEELTQASLNGDRAAFGELVDRYETKIYNLALRVTGNAEDAMDATQWAFLKAYDNLHGFDSRRRFFSWLYRIGLNEALDVVGRRRWYSELDEGAPATTASPEREARGREIGWAIHRALQELQPDYRVAIVLRHLQELSYREMSEIIGIPVKTVRSRLFTARRELRAKLAEKRFL